MKDSDDEADTETNDESEDFDFSGVKVETFFTVAFLFELGLVLVAALVGYMTSGTPFPFELKLTDYQWVLRRSRHVATSDFCFLRNVEYRASVRRNAEDVRPRQVPHRNVSGPAVSLGDSPSCCFSGSW